MKRAAIWFSFIIGLSLLWPAVSAQTQSPGVEVVITQVDGPSPQAGPNVTAYVSVVADVKSAITDLPADRFTVYEDGQQAPSIQVNQESVGLAVVFVLDVSKSMDFAGVVENTRLGDSKSLIFHFASADQVRLATEDLSGLVVIHKDPDDGSQIINPLSGDHVGNLYNALANFERGPSVANTPLKEGVEQAIKLFQNPADPAAAARLPRMRQAIVILSDGLDLKSKKAETEDLINQAQAAGVNLYTIGIDSQVSNYFDDEALQRLANQTNGEFRHHNSREAHDDTLALFDRLFTQRNQYRITYPTHAAKGSDHRVRIKVQTDQSSVPASDDADFSSSLEPPSIEILWVEPQNITWQGDIAGPCLVTVTARLSYPDGVSRPPKDIQLAVDGASKQTMTPLPDSDDIYVATFDAYGLSDGSHSLSVAFEDSVLIGVQQSSTQPINLAVSVLPTPTPTPKPTPTLSPTPTPTPTSTPRPPVQAVVEEAKTNWWIIISLCGLALFIFILFIVLLLRTRNVRQVIQRTTGRLKRPTLRLNARTPAQARLVVMSGYSKGREFRIPSATRVVKVSRDPEFGDFPLGDPHVSNPHFTITFRTTDAYITDEGSTNGTRIGGAPLQPHRPALLQRDAIIEAGGVQIQFKRIGGTTRVLPEGSGP